MGFLVEASTRLVEKIRGDQPRSAAFSLDPPSPLPLADLYAIPSETSPAERRFLFTFFASIWSGMANIVEIGPFLGGTTRAIALGMLANPARGEPLRIYTYDRFSAYYEPRDLERLLTPLFTSGTLSSDVREVVAQTGSFAEAFDAIHRSTPYGGLIVTRAEPLPDTVEEKDRPGIFTLSGTPSVEAFFVDGCKSWYATKHFAREAIAAATPGAWLILQDFAWYTCFWLPALIHILRDSVALRLYVDGTYAFQLTDRVEPAEIDERFPDLPEGMDMEQVFGDLRMNAIKRVDARAEVVHELQHAAALAYVGELDQARLLIARTRRRHRMSVFKEQIEAAARAPTYRPGGESVRL